MPTPTHQVGEAPPNKISNRFSHLFKSEEKSHFFIQEKKRKFYDGILTKPGTLE